MSTALRARLVAAVFLIALAAAPAASAKVVRYAVPPAPAYAVKDQGNGIVKVTYNGCVTAGERQSLAFDMAVDGTGDGTAAFKVLKEEGEAPVTAFDPASVTLRKGEEQTIRVNLTFGLDDANNGRTTFRIKLDPDAGQGLGEGPGIMVTIACVLAAPPAPQGGPPQGGPQGAPPAAPAPGPAPAPANGTLVTPTVGRFPAVAGVQASSPSPCVATPVRVRLRVGETTRVRVVVSTNGQRIQGAMVRATYPGGRQIKRSDASGVVIFRIRARRTGRLVLQSDVCFGADRRSVLGARAVDSNESARFTG